METNFNTLRRNLYHIRAKFIPKKPKSLKDIEVAFQNSDTHASYGETNGAVRKPFYRGTKITPNYGFVVFASQNIIESLPQMGTTVRILADGTMQSSKKEFIKQLYIFHVEYKNHVSVFF